MELHFSNLLIVVAAGFTAPFVLGFFPKVRLPAIVFELVLGIILGPAVLGWVSVDEPVTVMSLIGLAVLLFLAGIEIEFDMLRGKVLRATLIGFVLSFGIAIVLGLILKEAGLVKQPIFLAVLLCATSLGVLVPVLKDAGQVNSTFGQLVIAAGSIADFGAVILLSLLFSEKSTSTTSQVILLVGLFVVALLIGLAVAGIEHSKTVRMVLARLQDTTAQIRVRAAFLILIGFVALAGKLGLEVILGAFLAGAIVSLVDQDRQMTHPLFRRKLEAIGFGVFIPVFFVTSGVKYDLNALTSSGSTIVRVPIFLAALMLARGLPALLYGRLIPRKQVAIAGLMQGTSLPFIVAGTAIGQQLGLISAGSSAALIAAGLLSVLIFPALSLSLLRGAGMTRQPMTPQDAAETVVPAM
ncbi:MAG TPA: cation:proton antiporter [Solirubrobacteraceae bacterium]|jgi:Kef-type K+ transport system membrane component KefB|nr:cation:proton antiporter [Solirubrobacteraceae bacterium]